ncbi:helix-turn-helix domain-containing protein [Mycobacterium sp. ITM-2016-00318]|uniref:AlbA family DNA-binding domain-containing protein n=1 Tax=Mycobacterium sp. ITM-2016-00318 TaxID=2099693 RepID=UPI000CF8BB57|nr:ATP-binding protein [Mycobacterium sp. ITM-2016-00318]WNG95001.1 ATP-binding protein [Mycobacterium sp. ITM-2016-00318]
MSSGTPGPAEAGGSRLALGPASLRSAADARAQAEPSTRCPGGGVIVPDGRTDYEKLLELLGNPEETHLDLKASVDIAAQDDKVKFVKDVVTMSNRPPGGYILIGVNDAGDACMQIGTIADRSRFDGAKLGSLVRKYIEGEIHLRVQIHEHNGNEIVMVFVPHHRDGLPVPFSKDGQYPKPGGKTETVFRTGEIFVREGAENVPIRHAHWPDVLSAYTQRIREESSNFAQQMIREFLAAREGSTGGAKDVPLSMNMDTATFSDATLALIEAGNDVRLRHFIQSLVQIANPELPLEDFERMLNLWTTFCAQALYFTRADLVDEAIGRLREAYTRLGIGVDDTRKRLAVVIRLYALGSLAVRLEAWETAAAVALQPVPSDRYSNEYIYSSWIRHAQVDASRANLTDGRHGFIISAARELLVQHPPMRPDVAESDVPPEADVGPNDVLLNSLCQFDLAYCIIVFAKGTGHAEAYPSSAAFSEDRADPIAQRIVADAGVRERLIADTSVGEIAHAMREVFRRAMTESLTYGGRWWGPPPTVDAFIKQHDPQIP